MPERGFSLEDSDYGMQMGYEAYPDEGLRSIFLEPQQGMRMKVSVR